MSVTPLVVLDCDSTTIQDEVIELLADAAGTRELVAEVTERAMRGELDFAESLAERVATLTGTPEAVFGQAYARVRLSPGIRELIAAVHERGGKVGVVSGGFHEVLDPIAEDLGLDFWRANRLEVADGALTGRTVGPVIDAEAKAVALAEWAEASGIPLSATVAIGDGANDLKMMAVAAIGVGYNAKPIVREQADVSIEGDLGQAIPLLDRLT
ncbi:phosphoserine phosphatase SerB [Leucobacter aridicollis]|uniref:phosphoserine phosphatase n=1 Tax=Leucobacter aridicollis TaxID=283878 RepID=A0A852RBG8_9MICO|nr:phosphoserine phosphatase SerB [Leucobacter aridicollis]MBL3683685.1 phosphoserine phosphatase SerB [Leucobacter aridicollis]NYD26706.1 phosphoserine phosphatase [Leucobacter aridicollis]